MNGVMASVARQLAARLTPALTLLAAACASAAHIERRNTASAPEAAAAQAAVATERALDANVTARRTISVLPFKVEALDTIYAPLGYGFAELLLSDLAVSHQLAVVERMRLDAAREEIAMSVAGQTDPATALRVGRLLAAQRLVVGSLTVPADTALQFTSGVANVETSELQTLLAGRTTMGKIFAAERELVFRLFTDLGVTLSTAELALLNARPAPEPRAFIVFSRGVQAEAKGDLVGAAMNFEMSAQLDGKFELASQSRERIIQRAAQAGVSVRAAIEQAAAKMAEAKAAEARALEAKAAEARAAEAPRAADAAKAGERNPTAATTAAAAGAAGAAGAATSGTAAAAGAAGANPQATTSSMSKAPSAAALPPPSEPTSSRAPSSAGTDTKRADPPSARPDPAGAKPDPPAVRPDPPGAKPNQAPRQAPKQAPKQAPRPKTPPAPPKPTRPPPA